MSGNTNKNAGPLVSVVIATFNRPRYLSEALASVLRQTYTNLEVIVVNDGGQDVSDEVNSPGDKRVTLIGRKENRGKAFSLNQALTRATGKYIAYLDDDDLYYPNHIETLVNALETRTDCQVAYSDFYKACCKTLPDGTRQVLSKVVEVSRDFDRFFMLYFNHVLHVCLMHRRELLDKTGPYNEDLSVLIDWDMTRRLSFFSDFYHVVEITGEYYNPIGQPDRISVLRRRDKKEYLKTILTIRTTRPNKPWPKLEDTSIIFVTDRLDETAKKTIAYIWRYTFFPYRLHLPLPQNNIDRLKTDMPNVVLVPVSPSSTHTQRIDAALQNCDGEYVTIVSSGFPIKDFWIENSLYALSNGSISQQAFELEGSTETLWSVVLRKADLQFARRAFADLPIRQSLGAANIVIKRPHSEELPFQFDNLLQQAQLSQRNGDWLQAARKLEHIADRYQNRLWMKSLASRAFFEAGDHNKAAELINEVNQQRPTVDTFLLEAKLNRDNKKFTEAIESLKKAQRILEGSQL